MSRSATGWRRWLLEPEITLGSIILLAFLILSSLQVLTRYVLAQPLAWTEELASNLLIWLTFIGATAVQRDDSHVRVELIQELLGARIAGRIYALYDVFILIWLGCVLVGGWRLMGQMTFEKTPALRIPYSVILSIVPITAAIMFVYVVINMVRRLRARGC